MKPIRTETSDIVFKKDGCGDLPARSCTMSDDVTPCVETVWELTEEEKQQVMESGRVYLYLVGGGVQPCFITTEPAILVKGN
jgi:hypothetical protein